MHVYTYQRVMALQAYAEHDITDVTIIEIEIVF